MNIYLISQNINKNYDTYDSAIVLANSETEAKLMHPGGPEVGIWGHEIGSWAFLEDIKVEYLGEASAHLGNEPYVILASFNAG